MKPIHRIRIIEAPERGFGTAVILGILIPQLAVANPLGPQVVSGQASFATREKTSPSPTATGRSSTGRTSPSATEEAHPLHPAHRHERRPERVSGNNPSAIYGALQSNGRVYLVNQNGIFIGPTATIDVKRPCRSTLNITDSDFKAGRINFSGGPLAGKIENQGAIRTPAGAAST